MEKYELSKIGEFHINHNEDSSVITEIGEDKILIAVMDGCSMGKESHFASTLVVKLLRKIGKEISYKEFVGSTKKLSSEYLEIIRHQLFRELGQLKNQLHLEKSEMLSTLILGVLDIKNKEIELITIGDGLICCNGVLFEYEQEMPIIDVLTKTEDGWLMKTYTGLDKEIYFKSIEVTLKMADIYSKVENLKDPQAVLEFGGDEE
jgi:hypothetical protein